MRAVMVIAMLGSFGLAEPMEPSSARAPAVAASGPIGPDGGLHLARPPGAWEPYTPPDLGGFSGTVIAPPPTPDARPYPRGMVIAPPDVGDTMALAAPRPWHARWQALWRDVSGRVDALWRSLRTPPA